jgi:threonine dehydratase
VPVGGGGLIAGIAAYVKRIAPRTKVIGVEPADSNAMQLSLAAGRRVTLPHVNLFADGVAVRQVGRETFRLCRELVDDMVLVDTDEICAAIKDIFEDTRTVSSPRARSRSRGPSAGSNAAARRDGRSWRSRAGRT